MKFLKIIALFLVTISVNSQTVQQSFTFETKYYKALDKWVIFPKAEDETDYSLGFIYLDETAGFTFDYKWKLYVVNGSLELVNTTQNETIGFMKYRLERNTKNVQVLTDEQVKTINLEPVPDWLETYNKNKGTLDYQVNLASFYNGFGDSKAAIEILKEEYKKEKNHEKLLFELGFAYNVLKQFDDAINLMTLAIKTHPKNELFYKEIVYAYMNTEQLELAENSYNDYIKNADKKTYTTETSYNIAYSYYVKKNIEKFNQWAAITKENTESDTIFYKNLELMKKDLETVTDED
jgi:tetratricopeptide (TPR) repeat protein